MRWPIAYLTAFLGAAALVPLSSGWAVQAGLVAIAVAAATTMKDTHRYIRREQQ